MGRVPFNEDMAQGFLGVTTMALRLIRTAPWHLWCHDAAILPSTDRHRPWDTSGVTDMEDSSSSSATSYVI